MDKEHDCPLCAAGYPTRRISNQAPEPQYLMPGGRKPIVVIHGSGETAARLEAMDFSALEERVAVIIDNEAPEWGENPADIYAKMYGFPVDHPSVDKLREYCNQPVKVRDEPLLDRVPDNRKQRRKENSKKGGPPQMQTRKFGNRNWQ